MNRFFPDVNEHRTNLYIADYTEQTKGSKRIEFSTTPFSDIDHFSINNKIGHVFQSVNFETNLLCDGNGLKIKQCECLCASVNPDGWICLIEMKYCRENTIGKNVRKAYEQLLSVYDFCKANSVLNGRKQVYLIISIPPHETKAPFENFVFPPGELAKIKRTCGYIIRGVNSIEIEDNRYLKV